MGRNEIRKSCNRYGIFQLIYIYLHMLDYTLQIDTGAGYTDFDSAQFEKLNIEANQDNKLYLTEASGSVAITGSEFDTLYALKGSVRLPARLYRDGKLEIDGYINLNGKWNNVTKVCQLSLVNDNPINKFEKIIGDEFNALEYSPAITTNLIRSRRQLKVYGHIITRIVGLVGGAGSDIVEVIETRNHTPAPTGSAWERWLRTNSQPQWQVSGWFAGTYWGYELSFAEYAASYGGYSRTGVQRAVDVYAREEVVVSNSVVQILLNENSGWILETDNGDGTSLIVRTLTDAGYSVADQTEIVGLFFSSSPTLLPTPNPSDDTYFQDTAQETSFYFGQEVWEAVAYSTVTLPAVIDKTWINASVVYDTGKLPYKNALIFTELVRDRIYDQVPEIVFDADSFKFREFAYPTANDLPLDFLCLHGITDVRPLNAAGDQLPNQSTILKITLKKLFNWFKNRNIFYYIEVVSGVYYFRMAHISQIVQSVSSIDITDLGGKDWSEDVNIVDIAKLELIRRRMQRPLIAENIDFISNAIIFNKVKDIQAETKEIVDDFFYLDISDIQYHKERYPDNSINSAFLGAYNNEIDLTANLITGWTVNSGWISFNDSGTDIISAEANPVGLAVAQTNTFSLTAGEHVRLGFNCTTDDVLNTEIKVILGNQSANVIKTIRNGMNEVYLIADTTGTAAIEISVQGGGTISLISVTLIKTDPILREAYGELSGTFFANADLSAANTNRYLMPYDLQDDDIKVNGSDITATVKRIEQLSLILPLYYMSDLNLTELLQIPSVGNMEIDGVTIPANGGFAKFNGRI